MSVTEDSATVCVPDVQSFAGLDLDTAWQGYWDQYGECLVWQGWVNKYPEQIDYGVSQAIPCVEEVEVMTEGQGTSQSTLSGQNVTEGQGASQSTLSGQSVTEGQGASQSTESDQNVTEGQGTSQSTLSGQNVTEGQGTSQSTLSSQNVTDGLGASQNTESDQNVTEGQGAPQSTESDQNVTEGQGAPQSTESDQNVTKGQGASHSTVLDQNVSSHVKDFSDCTELLDDKNQEELSIVDNTEKMIDAGRSDCDTNKKIENDQVIKCEDQNSNDGKDKILPLDSDVSTDGNKMQTFSGINHKFHSYQTSYNTAIESTMKGKVECEMNSNNSQSLTEADNTANQNAEIVHMMHSYSSGAGCNHGDSGGQDHHDDDTQEDDNNYDVAWQELWNEHYTESYWYYYKDFCEKFSQLQFAKDTIDNIPNEQDLDTPYEQDASVQKFSAGDLQNEDDPRLSCSQHEEKEGLEIRDTLTASKNIVGYEQVKNTQTEESDLNEMQHSKKQDTLLESSQPEVEGDDLGKDSAENCDDDDCVLGEDTIYEPEDGSGGGKRKHKGSKRTNSSGRQGTQHAGKCKTVN